MLDLFVSMLSTVDDKGDKATTGGMMKRQSPQQQGITNYFDVKSVQVRTRGQSPWWPR